MISSIYNEDIRQKIASLKDEVAKGTHSYDEYKAICGRIRGLSEAQEMFNDLVKKLRKDSDFDED